MSHPTRHILLEAGSELAESRGLAQMTVDAIVDKAGFGKGTFYVHFSDRIAFLVALHAQFHERLLSLAHITRDGRLSPFPIIVLHVLGGFRGLFAAKQPGYDVERHVNTSGYSGRGDDLAVVYVALRGANLCVGCQSVQLVHREVMRGGGKTF